MKNLLKPTVKLLITCILLAHSMLLHAQPTYTSELKNDLMVSSTVYEFDLYLTRTGTTPLELANFQAAITVNPAFVNGGTITPSIVSGTSDLNTAQQPSSIAFSATQNCIKIAPKAPPRTLDPGTLTSATNGTLVSITGTRVCRVRLTNTTAFGNFPVAPVWNFTLQPYRTMVTAFVGPTDHKVNTIITLAESHSKTLDLTLYTQGLYDATAGTLRKVKDVDVLNAIVDKYAGLTADLVTVQLAAIDAPYTVAYSATNVNLNTNGSCRVPLPGSLTGNYYVVIKHRNSVETWSKTGGESFTGNAIAYNFTTSASQAYASNQKNLGSGVWGLYSGDINQDGFVENVDLNSIYNKNINFARGYSAEDLTGDSYVENADLTLVYNNNVSFVRWNTPAHPVGKKKK
jgi:hypothetical protein